jgi:hypothetical protein
MKFFLFTAIVILYSFVEASMKTIYTTDIIERSKWIVQPVQLSQVYKSHQIVYRQCCLKLFRTSQTWPKNLRSLPTLLSTSKPQRQIRPFCYSSSFLGVRVFYTVSASTKTKPLHTSSGSERKTGQLQNNPCKVAKLQSGCKTRGCWCSITWHLT